MVQQGAADVEDRASAQFAPSACPPASCVVGRDVWPPTPRRLTRRASLGHGRSSTASAPHWCGNSPVLFRRSEEHTSELQSRPHLVCRLLLEKKKHIKTIYMYYGIY